MQYLGDLWNVLWQTLLNILVAINSVVHVPGLSIIVFTVLVRLLVVPLTVKSLKSNRAMQQVQPLLKEIQRKYKDDRAKQQEEQMKLYHQYGINPAAGCFPMLIQIPIFFGLYSALRFTLDHGTDLTQLQGILWVKDWVGTQHNWADFTGAFLWIPSLAKQDPFYIRPVLSALFQFFQTKMSMPRRDPNMPQDSQQKMMNGIMQFMPLYILFISINFPAGNVIYWACSSLFGAVQQYFITGFGSLPDFPGFGWLPRKDMTPPPPPPPPLPGQTVKKGLMSKMMERALEAQEAQKSAQEQAKLQPPEGGTPTRDLGQATKALENTARTRPQRSTRDGTSTARVKSKASEQHVHIVATEAPKYASDIKYRGGDGGRNGYTSAGGKTTQLPSKKRSKK